MPTMSNHSALTVRGRVRRLLLALAATTLAALAMAIASQARASTAEQAPVRPASRAEATALVAEARRIVVPGGIERLEKVRIGGIDQWISVRGRDPDNPVLLVLHGGPGYTLMPLAWWNERGWDEYFTVVHWDQRAAGRTHLLTDADEVAPTLTVERMYADAEEVVAWVRRTLDKPRVFVLGHSWGTALGLRLAHEHPDWLLGYVGVAQVVHMRGNERRNWQRILDKAERTGNTEAAAALRALAPYAADGQPVPIEHIYTQRRWGERLGGTLAYRDGNRAESSLLRLSPEYADPELAHAWDGNAFATPLLFGQVLDLDYSDLRHFEVPVMMFLGRHDMTVDSQAVADWFEGVQAPQRNTVWFEHSAHSPMFEEPGRFLLNLVQALHPIAAQAGDLPATSPDSGQAR